MRAWVVRWDGMGDHARVDQPIAAILPWQLGVRQVKKIVEVLYAAREYAPIDMLEAARPKGHNPYRAQLGTVTVQQGDQSVQVPWEGEILCGHNPWLHARQATVTPKGDGSGDVVFEFVPRPQIKL